MRAACVAISLAVSGPVWVAACAREPLDTCPDVAPGDLVVTEVQGDEDATNGSWVELFNASGRSLALEGLKIRFRKKDGSGEFPALVRRPLTVAAGDYVVLGRYFDNQRPAHVDYGFLDDYEGQWLGAAAIDVEVCGERVDLAQYDVLPDEGTFSFGGTPDPIANDDSRNWCTDPTPTGTPGAENTPCP